MSNLPKSSDIPSNEDIINEITKDFNNFNVDDSNKSENKDFQSRNSDNPSNSSEIPSDFEQEESENLENTIPDDFVDEEKLKDLEIELTAEEKKERHEKALDFKNRGNDEFKHKNYLESVLLYTEGLRICPLEYDTDRAVLYANRAASKGKLDRKQSAIDDCSKAIELNIKYVKAYLRRANFYEETEKFDESLEDYKKVLEFDPGNKDAAAANIRLPPLIQERNEKLKTEMLGKLKDLGNVILRPFGLSTENFQLQQDPNTGGYSINFKQGTG